MNCTALRWKTLRWIKLCVYIDPRRRLMVSSSWWGQDDRRRNVITALSDRDLRPVDLTICYLLGHTYKVSYLCKGTPPMIFSSSFGHCLNYLQPPTPFGQILKENVFFMGGVPLFSNTFIDNMSFTVDRGWKSPVVLSAPDLHVLEGGEVHAADPLSHPHPPQTHHQPLPCPPHFLALHFT